MWYKYGTIPLDIFSLLYHGPPHYFIYVYMVFFMCDFFISIIKQCLFLIRFLISHLVWHWIVLPETHWWASIVVSSLFVMIRKNMAHFWLPTNINLGLEKIFYPQFYVFGLRTMILYFIIFVRETRIGDMFG